MNPYYLGIYKTSLTTVNSIFSLITLSTTPILFSSLSRAQNDELRFKNIFFKNQKMVSYLILPISIGIFLYSDIYNSKNIIRERMVGG